MNLPPIIEQPPHAGRESGLPEEKKDEIVFKADFSGKIDLGVKKIVICITRDMDAEDMRVLQSYGKVLEYDHDCHNNLPANLFQWDYLIIDLRQSGDRYFLAKQIYHNRDKYAVVAFHYAFEFNVLDDMDNEFTSFPKKQGLREDYESLLMTRRVEKPRWYVSLFTCLFNVYSGIKK
jgi:hypothetical protein